MSAPETFGNHGAHGSGHRLEVGGDVDVAHLGEGDGAFAEVDGEIAHALEVVIYFQGGDDEADVGIEHFALAEHADGVLVNQDFHFVDAGLGEEDFAGEAFVAFEQSPEGAIDRGLHRARLGHQIVHQHALKDTVCRLFWWTPLLETLLQVAKTCFSTGVYIVIGGDCKGMNWR